MLNKLTEEDFAALRIPLESGRQTPNALGGVLLLFVPFFALLLFLTYYAAGDSTGFPWKINIMYIHFTLSIVIIILSIIFSFPVLYKKHEAIQYLVTALLTMNTGICFFLSSVFLIWDNRLLEKDVPVIKTSIIAAVIIGVLVFVVTWIRFMILLKKGEYRPGSKKESIRGRIESMSLVMPAIVIGTGLSMFLQAVFRTMTIDGNELFIILVGPLLLYLFLFVLPEQIVIIYCKKRFKSFTFDEEGNLYPIGSGEK